MTLTPLPDAAVAGGTHDSYGREVAEPANAYSLQREGEDAADGTAQEVQGEVVGTAHFQIQNEAEAE